MIDKNDKFMLFQEICRHHRQRIGFHDRFLVVLVSLGSIVLWWSFVVSSLFLFLSLTRSFLFLPSVYHSGTPG